MRSWKHLFALPTGLLLATLARATSSVHDHDLDLDNTTRLAQPSDDVWPYNLPPTVKYFPEHREHVRREENAASILLGLRRSPDGLRKMSADPNEKFFLGYWDLPRDLDTREEAGSSRWEGQEIGHERREQARWENATVIILPLDPAAVLHSHGERSLGWNIFRRAFQCPAGTNPCTSVGTSDLCCPNGQTCVITSNGIGCCPSGQTCGNTVAQCDTGAGYTSCPNSSNGGCCVPGASCLDIGCVFYGTQIVTTNLPAATVTRTPTSTSSSIFPTTTTQAATVTVTITGAGTIQTTTITTPTTIIIGGTLPTTGTCTAGFLSCPASLGGGCCPTNQACASGTQCTATATSTDNASAPVRGTSISTLTTSGPLTTSTSYASLCPTGYYMCSAVYLGGCCQVDRDCHTLSCPPTASTSVVNSAVATVVVPAGGAGSCANGWYICAAAQGGGCCPLGYECGANSCVRAEASATLTTGKEGPTATGNAAVGRPGAGRGGERAGGGVVMVVLGLGSAVAGVGMVLF